MHALIDFIDGYHPLYRSVVEGYSEQAVSDLELYLERALPGRQRDFLLTIGKNPGFPTGDLIVDPAEVTSLVTNRAAFPDYLAPFGVDDGPSWSDYYLDLRFPASRAPDGSVDDARVVRIAAGGPITDAPLPRAHSLTDMMFTWTFSAVRQQAHAEHASLWWDVPGAGPTWPSLARLEALMAELGFETLPHTSMFGRMFERGDAAAWSYQRPEESVFTLVLSAQDRPTLLGVSESLRRAMPTPGALDR